MKSFFRIAPELPPPPYTSLIETSPGLTVVGAATVRPIGADPDRACASVTAAGTVFAPGVVASGTVVEKLKTLSAAVTSPCVASSKNCCVAEPPTDDRSPVTVRPVLAGFVPGVTATVSRVDAPAVTVDG